MSARSFRLRVVLTAVVSALSSSAFAQMSDADYSNLSHRISPGDSLFVTTRTEGEIKGRLVRLSPDEIVVASTHGNQTIPFSNIGWIEQRGDPLWNGALIGAGLLGFSMMAGAGASCSPNCSSQVPQALGAGAAFGAGIGALIDWVIPGRTHVYGSLPAAADAGSFGSLWSQVKPGDRIAVRTTAGAQIKGRFARVSKSSIAVDVRDGSRDIPVNEVAEVRRYRGGTHVKAGLMIGIPYGALTGSSACYSDLHAPPFENGDTGVPCAAGVVLGAAAGGAVGALLGGMTWGSRVVYTVAPVASAHSAGVIASFAF
jgi:hypothetical protein